MRKTRLLPETSASRVADGGRSDAKPGPEESRGGREGVSSAAAPGTGASGCDGAGPEQDGYDKLYVLQNARVCGQTDTPILKTSPNVRSLSQRATSLPSLQIFGGASVAPGLSSDLRG